MNDAAQADFLPIDRRDALSYEAFVEQYALPGKPVVLTGLMRDWEAARVWNFEYFRRRHGHVTIVARRSDDYDRTITLPLADYLDRIDDPDAHFYLKDWVFENDIPELRAQYRVPRHFANWVTRVPGKWQPKWRWLYIGPASSASHLHVDFLLTSAWNALFVGAKRWLAYSPDQARRMYRGAVDAFHPDLERFPGFARARAHARAAARRNHVHAGNVVARGPKRGAEPRAIGELHQCRQRAVFSETSRDRAVPSLCGSSALGQVAHAPFACGSPIGAAARSAGARVAQPRGCARRGAPVGRSFAPRQISTRIRSTRPGAP